MSFTPCALSCGLLPGIPTVTADDIAAVLDYLALKHGIDLHDYRAATVARRLPLRLAATGSTNGTEYLRRLESDPAEPWQLLCTLLIPVTSFFRDPEVFAALEHRVLPALFDAAGDRPVRVWAAGVASGEEAWSVAILLDTIVARRGRGGFEVLGTDLDARLIEGARAACYPLAVLDSVPEDLRIRYFTPVGRNACIVDALRQHVRFAQHDLVGHRLAPKEAILASFDLVIARNVLIYFAPRLQCKVLERFAAVLEPGGALVLGMSEALPPACRARYQPYPELRQRLRIFQKMA